MPPVEFLLASSSFHLLGQQQLVTVFDTLCVTEDNTRRQAQELTAKLRMTFNFFDRILTRTEDMVK